MITNRAISTVIGKVRSEMSHESPPVVTMVARMAKDSFRVLVATVLSLRTQDKVTAAACDRLFARAVTPKQLAMLSANEIEKLIYPVGFYRTKAKSLKAIAKKLLDEYNGTVPSDIDTLLTFPGVGRKTANLVLSEGYNIPAMCVDTHVHRISNRWGYVNTTTPEKTETALRAILPKKHWLEYNYLLVAFGQHRCTPLRPRCSDCPVRQWCPRIGVTTSR